MEDTLKNIGIGKSVLDKISEAQALRTKIHKIIQ